MNYINGSANGLLHCRAYLGEAAVAEVTQQHPDEIRSSSPGILAFIPFGATQSPVSCLSFYIL